VKKGILVNEVKKLQAEVARLGQENGNKLNPLGNVWKGVSPFFLISALSAATRPPEA